MTRSGVGLHGDDGAPPEEAVSGRFPISTGARITALAQEISTLWSRWGAANLEFDLAAGAAIVDGLYGGNVDAWRKRRKSDPSFRRLSAGLENRVSAKRLYHAVCTCLLIRSAGGVSRWKHLSVSHFHAVAGVPQSAALLLLDHAERDHLSVDSLRTLANPHRPSGRGGRRPKPLALKHLEGIARSPLPSETEIDVSEAVQASPQEQRGKLGVDLIDRGSSLIRFGTRVTLSGAPGLRVLVVDDEASVRATTRRWMEGLGCSVETASNGSEAFAFPPACFDVALVDVRLGFDCDGIELGRRLLDEGRASRVLLISGFPEQDDIERAKAVGPLLDRADVPSSLYTALAEIARDAARR